MEVRKAYSLVLIEQPPVGILSVMLMIKLMVHSHCMGPGAGSGLRPGMGTGLGMGKWVYNPLVLVLCPCVVCTVKGIDSNMKKPLFPLPVPFPFPVLCSVNEP